MTTNSITEKRYRVTDITPCYRCHKLTTKMILVFSGHIGGDSMPTCFYACPDCYRKELEESK